MQHEERESDGDNAVSQASEGELKWFKDLAEIYWIPSKSHDEDQGDLSNSIRLILPDSTPARFLDDFARAEANIKAVQEFLQMPYIAIMGTMACGDQESISAFASQTQSQKGRFIASVLQLPSAKGNLDGMMRQAVVLLWGAYETFSRDLFVSVLNERPSLLSKLVAKKQFKDRFPVNSVFSLETLQDAGFDLNGKLGNLLAEGKDFSAPWMLRSLFPTLFEDGSLKSVYSATFERPELWLLGHRRHVVAHRCGIVDAAYMKETGDKSQASGELLKVTRKDLRFAFGCVHLAIAVALASAAELFGKLKDIPD